VDHQYIHLNSGVATRLFLCNAAACNAMRESGHRIPKVDNVAHGLERIGMIGQSQGHMGCDLVTCWPVPDD